MKTLSTFVLSILTWTLCGQNFEGKITYQNKYTSKISQLSSDKLTTMLGSTQEYLIKGGDYKSVTNGTFSEWQMYISKDNKLYTKLSANDTIFWQDAALTVDSIIDFKINKNVVNICGFECDELILKCKTSTQTFYYNSKLKVDPNLYLNHKYNMWYDYLKLTKALPLKIIFDSDNYTMENVAIEVKPMKFDPTTFSLPNGSPTSKSKY